ncbi:ribosome-assembly protein 3-domain-containing protein [Hypoxylon sp. NC1633]|nr:ribosome-assembly protein 3-domain-containing protein [Hypoxylon sp. NC1633]
MSKQASISQDFTTYYLQRSTLEFAEDLDRIRSADDFKGDAVAMLVKSLQQGTSLFSAVDQKRILKVQTPRDMDNDMADYGRLLLNGNCHEKAMNDKPFQLFSQLAYFCLPGV